jgi:hypothetical protein
MHKLRALTLLIVFAVSGIAAQQPLNYLIRSISSQIRSGQVVVEFDVINSGGTADSETTAHLFSSGGDILASESIRPLSANERVSVALTVPLSTFTPGSSQTLYAVVGLEQLPPAAQRTRFGNIGSTQVFIPDAAAQTTAEPAPPSGGLTSINLRSPQNIALVLGIVAVIVVLLWVLTVIVRMLFSRPPMLPAWQPPYVITPLVDPNSTHGRRQLWQQHAQSDTLPVPCAPGNYMVRKLLLGSNGVKLSGWHVTGMRISQYDRYGRVARSQTILPKKTVKALDRAVRKSATLDWERAGRAVRPVARTLTNILLKKSTPQNTILPIALDVRFVGMHGEVGILFELYGCVGGDWHEIDHWEPEMRVINGSIHENFTYTLLGQHPHETRKQFTQRLQTDLTHLLAAMVQSPPPPPPAPDTEEVKPISE